jgi:hypothetical protein
MGITRTVIPTIGRITAVIITLGTTRATADLVITGRASTGAFIGSQLNNAGGSSKA